MKLQAIGLKAYSKLTAEDVPIRIQVSARFTS